MDIWFPKGVGYDLTRTIPIDPGVSLTVAAAGSDANAIARTG